MVAIESRMKVLWGIVQHPGTRSRRDQDYYMAALNELTGVKSMLDEEISVGEWEKNCHRPEPIKRKKKD